MERAFILTSSAAAHPVRRTLPGAGGRHADIRLFLTTFAAGFIVFYGLIA